MGDRGKSDDKLKALYPFLHRDGESAGHDTVELLESIMQKAGSSARTKSSFFAENAESVLECARLIAQVYRRGGKMLAAGNGGSSCDAAHFCVEFQHPVTAGRKALTAVNLMSDIAMLTAISNDIGFESVLIRQLEAAAKPGDGLVCFSTSGDSRNLVAGLKKAKSMGLSTLAITGGGGGAMRLAKEVDLCLVVESDSIHRIQEVHVTIYHIVWDLVHTLLADDNDDKWISVAETRR